MAKLLNVLKDLSESVNGEPSEAKKLTEAVKEISRGLTGQEPEGKSLTELIDFTATNLKLTDERFKKIVERTYTALDVEILDGVESIGAYAFYQYLLLTSLTTPESLKNIGENAFMNCTNLENVDLSNGVESIGAYAFGSCNGLKNLVLGNKLKTIGNQAFNNCNNADFTSLTIPENVESIGAYAFYNNNLLEININVNGSIGEYAFSKSKSATLITIGTGVESIGANAFSSSTALTAIYIYAMTPPTLANVTAFNYTNDCPIYVPAESLSVYKNASVWSSLSSRIQAIPE